MLYKVATQWKSELSLGGLQKSLMPTCILVIRSENEDQVHTESKVSTFTFISRWTPWTCRPEEKGSPLQAVTVRLSSSLWTSFHKHTLNLKDEGGSLRLSARLWSDYIYQHVRLKPLLSFSAPLFPVEQSDNQTNKDKLPAVRRSRRESLYLSSRVCFHMYSTNTGFTFRAFVLKMFHRVAPSLLSNVTRRGEAEARVAPLCICSPAAVCLFVLFRSFCVFKRRFLPARDSWKEPRHEQKTSPQRPGGGGGWSDNTRKETRARNKLRLNQKTIKPRRWEEEEEGGGGDNTHNNGSK